jgi:cation diffusion facilitator CzcD-associated flavoprotein CzcO
MTLETKDDRAGGLPTSDPDHVDVLIVGAGLSGIGAAHHIQSAFPGKSYAILEARDAIGGTWDLFRYPGIRSDSDMQTLGYRFKPWTDAYTLADGPSILRYVRDTASSAGIDSHIRFDHRVRSAQWSTADARWTVQATRGDEDEPVTLTCGFLFTCCGYYRYDEGYTPQFEGTDRFKGPIVHPQHWPEDLDYKGKRVVVIGSGATAVTLVPAMADQAAHVTMLQRSPTYIVSMPAKDAIANALRRVFGARVAYAIARWKNVALISLVFHLSRRRPALVKRLIRRGLAKHLRPGFDIDTHFKPRYDPWDQRMCLVPDADLFEAINAGTVSVVTDHIETFTENGLRLRSGSEVEADVIVTATGLNLLPLGGIQLEVDGRDISLPDTMVYKGMMLDGVPNYAFTVGYTNASWTLKADLTAEYVCRLLAHMDRQGMDQCVPINDDRSVTTEPLIDFSSGYVQRSIAAFPQNGSRAPWKLRQNYAYDLMKLRHGPVTDEAMRFSTRPSPAERPTDQVELAA